MSRFLKKKNRLMKVLQSLYLKHLSLMKYLYFDESNNKKCISSNKSFIGVDWALRFQSKNCLNTLSLWISDENEWKNTSSQV